MVEKTIGNKKDDSVTVNYTLADSCADTTVVGATSSVSWLTAIASTPSNHAGTITITATEDGSDVTRYAFVTPSINGEPCDNNRIKVTQSPGEPPEPGVLACYRGTDNGTDYFKDGTKKSHPILLCGEVDSYMTDSIYVSGGLQYYTGSSTPTEDSEWKDLTETFLELDWVKLRVNKNGGCCGSGYIEIYTSQKYDIGTDGQRSASIWLRAKDRTIQVVPECAGQICSGPAGEQLCRQWEYEIKQCSVGYVWCGEHSTDATPIPCSEKGTCVSPREIKPPVCNCDEPPTPTCTCTATGHKNPISSTRTTEAVLLGTYSTTCEGTWSTTISRGDDFLTDFEFREDGNIYAKVSVDNTGKQRTSVYAAKIGDCLNEFTVVQAGAEQGCEVYVELTGLDEGDTVSLQWNTSTPSNVGNGTYENTLDSDTGSITARVSDSQGRYSFSPSEVSLTCDEYSKTITATKITPTCTCQEAEVRVEPTLIMLGSAEGSTAEATFSHKCEVEIDNTASNWIEVTELTNKLEFKALSETTSTRNGTIYIKDANGERCETISVSQDPPPPAAHTFSFKFKYFDYEEGPMVTGDYNRYTGYDVTDFEVDGQPATMQVEVYYRRSFFSSDNEDCVPTSFQNYTGGTSANSVQSYIEGTKWCGGSLIHVNGFNVRYNGVLIKQMQGHDSELDGTYEGEFS